MGSEASCAGSRSLEEHTENKHVTLEKRQVRDGDQFNTTISRTLTGKDWLLVLVLGEHHLTTQKKPGRGCHVKSLTQNWSNWAPLLLALYEHNNESHPCQFCTGRRSSNGRQVSISTGPREKKVAKPWQFYLLADRLLALGPDNVKLCSGAEFLRTISETKRENTILNLFLAYDD